MRMTREGPKNWVMRTSNSPKDLRVYVIYRSYMLLFGNRRRGSDHTCAKLIMTHVPRKNRRNMAPRMIVYARDGFGGS